MGGVSLLLAALIVACGPPDAIWSFVGGFILLVPLAVAVVASAIAAAWPIVRRIVPDEPLSLRIATSGALGLGLQGFLVLGVGLAGWINHATAVAIVLIPGTIGAIDLLIAHRRRCRADGSAWQSADARKPSQAAWILLAVSPIAAVCICGSAMFPGILWTPDPLPYDVTSYHLQVPRQWFDAGRITPLKENIFSYFPHGGETLDLLTMEIAGDPWVGMYGAQFLSLFETALMLAAIWGGVMAIAKTHGAMDPHRATLAAALATLTAASVPWIAMLSCVAYIESLMLLHTAAATVWALLAATPGKGRWRYAVLAGACAGLACGTKYTAVAMTLIPLAAAVAAAMWRGRALRLDVCYRRMVRVPAVLLLSGAVVFSPWLIRNLVWAGNPIFPVALHKLGSHNLTAAQVERFEVAHAPRGDQATLAGRGRSLADQVLFWWQYGYLLVPLGFAAAFARIRHPTGAFFGVVTISIAVVWLFFTHLEGRFFVPMIPTAALAGGAWMVQSPLRGRVIVAIAAIATAVSFAIGLSILLTQFVRQAQPGRQSLYFVVMQDHSRQLTEVNLELEPVAERVAQGDFKLALIGNAAAFRYPMPSSHLLYRDVFDVNIPAGVSLIDGWLGQSVQSLRREGYWVDIDLGELGRLSEHYRNLPAPDVNQIETLAREDVAHRSGYVLLPPLAPN